MYLVFFFGGGGGGGCRSWGLAYVAKKKKIVPPDYLYVVFPLLMLLFQFSSSVTA